MTALWEAADTLLCLFLNMCNCPHAKRNKGSDDRCLFMSFFYKRNRESEFFFYLFSHWSVFSPPCFLSGSIQMLRRSQELQRIRVNRLSPTVMTALFMVRPQGGRSVNASVYLPHVQGCRERVVLFHICGKLDWTRVLIVKVFCFCWVRFLFCVQAGGCFWPEVC